MRNTAFIDEVEIITAGGDGGNGIVSFLRERARPFGGPDGGDGGRGGNVLMTASTAVNTLLEFRYRRQIIAGNGNHGKGKMRSGRNGDDIHLQVPPGTRVIDADTGELHADLTTIGDTIILAAGGRGGAGNTRFKSSLNRAPRTAGKGEKSVIRRFRLQLTLLADIGLLGLPNAGKSTFLRAISAAKPKIADYPFTTMKPQLGYLDNPTPGGAGLIIADLPGLIRGAATGAGLGNRFLRHLSRTAMLCHLIDLSSATAVDDCRTVEEELKQAATGAFDDKPRWLLLNKIDLLSAQDRRQRQAEMAEFFPPPRRLFPLSAKTGEGVPELVHQLLTCRA